MTVEELYVQIGGDYADVLRRIPSDALIGRIITQFADDTSCANLLAAWQTGDEKAAFEAAHTAKGVCANLSLTRLSDLASTITEALRPGNETLLQSTDVNALILELSDVHAATLKTIAAFAEE